MSCPRHPNDALRPFERTKGKVQGPGFSCTKWLGLGEPGANAKGWCDHWEPAQAAPRPPQAQPAPQASVGASSPSPGNLRLEAAGLALHAAAHAGGSKEDVVERAWFYYHRFLKLAVTGEVPEPVPQEIPF